MCKHENKEPHKPPKIVKVFTPQTRNSFFSTSSDSSNSLIINKRNKRTLQLLSPKTNRTHSDYSLTHKQNTPTNTNTNNYYETN